MTDPLRNRTGALVNALTIDVEDYFHVTAFTNDVDRARWATLE